MVVVRACLGHWTRRTAVVVARHNDSHLFTLGNILHRLSMVFTTYFKQHPGEYMDRSDRTLSDMNESPRLLDGLFPMLCGVTGSCGAIASGSLVANHVYPRHEVWEGGFDPPGGWRFHHGGFAVWNYPCWDKDWAVLGRTTRSGA